MRHSSKQSGFGLLDIVLGFAVFSIICIPVIIFVNGYDPLRGYEYNAFAPKQDPYAGLYTDGDWSKSVSEISHVQDLLHPIDFASVKSCDLALAIQTSALQAGVAKRSLHARVTYHQPYQHQRNIPTSLALHDIDGESYMLLGVNSGSTTDPDLYVFTVDADDNGRYIIAQKRELSMGPGVIGMSVMQDMGYAIERSLVTPFWKLDLASVIATGSARIGLAPISSSSFASALPKAVHAHPDQVIVGAEKAYGSELFVFDQQSMAAQSSADMATAGLVSSIPYSIEIDAGVNDATSAFGMIGIATSKNPEMQVFDAENGNELFSYDAPGSSGNGKSLAWHDAAIGIARALGNEEFIGMYGGLGWMLQQRASAAGFPVPIDIASGHGAISSISTETFNPNVSLRHALVVHGGQKAILTTQTGVPAILVVERSSGNDDRYVESVRIELPAYAADIDCNSDALFVALESTSTPLAIIRFSYEE